MTTPVLAKVTICASSVRTETAVVPCGLKLAKANAVCTNRENHLYPIMTGFCNSGWHEGQKVNKPTCKFWINCPCNCHTQISFMLNLAGRERVLIDESTYVPDRGGFVQVNRTEIIRERVETKPDVRVVASPAPGLVPNTIERDFAATVTGRAAKGELESWVREITDIWVVEGGVPCTPQFVSDEIARIKGLVKGPSTGAIDAVFKRWAAIGFAHLEIRPNRFIGYTMEGIINGLEVMKEKAKR